MYMYVYIHIYIYIYIYMYNMWWWWWCLISPWGTAAGIQAAVAAGVKVGEPSSAVMFFGGEKPMHVFFNDVILISSHFIMEKLMFLWCYPPFIMEKRLFFMVWFPCHHGKQLMFLNDVVDLEKIGEIDVIPCYPQLIMENHRYLRGTWISLGFHEAHRSIAEVTDVRSGRGPRGLSSPLLLHR